MLFRGASNCWIFTRNIYEADIHVEKKYLLNTNRSVILLTGAIIAQISAIIPKAAAKDDDYVKRENDSFENYFQRTESPSASLPFPSSDGGREISFHERETSFFLLAISPSLPQPEGNHTRPISIRCGVASGQRCMEDSLKLVRGIEKKLEFLCEETRLPHILLCESWHDYPCTGARSLSLEIERGLSAVRGNRERATGLLQVRTRRYRAPPRLDQLIGRMNITALRRAGGDQAAAISREIRSCRITFHILSISYLARSA